MINEKINSKFSKKISIINYPKTIEFCLNLFKQKSLKVNVVNLFDLMVRRLISSWFKLKDTEQFYIKSIKKIFCYLKREEKCRRVSNSI